MALQSSIKKIKRREWCIPNIEVIKPPYPPNAHLHFGPLASFISVEFKISCAPYGDLLIALK